MVEIQKHIVRKGKRSVFSRPFHTKDDSETIAAWRSDLDRIRSAVEVRSFISAFCLKIVNSFYLQTELATGPGANDPTVLQGTSDTHVTVSDPQDDVPNPGVPENRRDDSKTNVIIPGVDHGSALPRPILLDKPADDHTVVSDVHHHTTKSQEDRGRRYLAVSIPSTRPSLSSGSSPRT